MKILSWTWTHNRIYGLCQILFYFCASPCTWRVKLYIWISCL